MDWRLGPVDFPTLGFQVVEWIETFLVHGPGDVQGDPIELDDDIVRFVCHVYRLDPESGRRVVLDPKRGRLVPMTHAVLSAPKGWSKSEIAGALVCAEALGPVRFDGWDANGDPVGRPVRSPFIRCLATEEDQTGNTYDNVPVMLGEGEAANAYPGVDIGITRTFLPAGGEITPSTSSSAAKDGGKETFAVSDETHLYVLPELKRMHATVRRNTGKRKAAEPWMLDTTTAFLPGERSVAEEMFETAEAILEGRARNTGIVVDHREAPPIKNWGSDRELHAALKSVYGPKAEWMDLDRIVADIRHPLAERADSERYWLNRRVRGSRRWVDPEVWKARAAEHVTVAPGELVTLGFDGSRTRDATALVGCRVSDGHVFMVAQADGSPAVWERPRGASRAGWEVPTNEVDAAVHHAMATLDVWRLYADPPYWQEYVDAWYGEFGQEKVVRWYTNRDVPMARAVENFETAVATDGFTHDGDPVLARHVGNAHRRKTRAGDVIEKETRDSTQTIDAAVAAVLSYEARGDAVAAGATKPRRSRVPVFL